MVTIKDVAEKAGVSTATVSRVLNGNENVSEDLRRKVMRAVQELNYKPIKSKVSALNRTIGVIVPDLQNYHYGDIVSGIELYASLKGFNVMVSTANLAVEKEEEIIERLFRKKVDGIILSTMKQDERYVKKLVDTGIPIVGVDRPIITLIGTATIDNKTAAFKMMKYIYTRGHRKILFIRGPEEDYYSAYDRLCGVKEFVKKFPDVELQLVGGYTFEAEMGYDVISKHLRNKGLNFTAIFAVNDLTAMGAIRALVDFDIVVPEEVSVGGFDNAPFAKFLVPSLTTIEQPRIEMGEKAAQLIIEKILNPNKANSIKEIILPTRIIERESIIQIK